MTYAELFRHTIELRTRAEDKDIPGLRSAMNKFLELAGVAREAECDKALLTEDGVRGLRAKGEQDGRLKPGGSSAWASRMKHVIRAYRDLAEREGPATFGEMLALGLKRSGMTQQDLAARIGVTDGAISHWKKGEAIPSAVNKGLVAKMDRILGLEGRLEAVYRLYEHKQRACDFFTDEQEAALRAGKGSLHHLVRYWAREKKVALKPMFAAAGIRAVLRGWLCSTITPGAPRRRDPALRTEDRTAIKHIDKTLGAGGKIAAVFDAQLSAQGPARGMLKFPYRQWPERLRQEFAQLEEYKIDNARGLGRSKDGVWTRTKSAGGVFRSVTRDGALEFSEALFGYAISGRGMKPQDLRLAHVIVPEIVTGHILARMKRNGRSQFNTGDTTALGSILGLIYSGGLRGPDYCGYFANEEVARDFWDDPYFSVRLPMEFTPEATGGYQIQTTQIPIPAHDKRGRWQAYLALVWKTLLRFEDSKEVLPASAFYKNIADILQDPDYDIGGWIGRGFSTLVASAPPKQSAPIVWAKHVRKCVLYLIFVTRAFRRETISRMEPRHLKYSPESNKYSFLLEEDMFKQRGRGASKGGVHAEVDDVLRQFETSTKPLIDPAATALLDLYIKEARPLLRVNGKSLFGWASEGSVGYTIGVISRSVLGRHVNPHAFRYLLATWCKRRGISIEDTAAVLVHLPATTKEIYALTTSIDVGRVSNKTIKKLYDTPDAA